jgi:glycosyltransferase involved in cell wall biosynthesis
MRVLHLLDSLNRGGAETIALDVCRNASSHGLEMTLVTLKGGPMEEDFRQSGIDFIKLNRRLPVDPAAVFALRRIIREKRIEIVHGYQAVDCMHLYFATRRLPVKKVLSFQGGITPDWKNIRALKFLIPRMDANIAVSKGLLAWHRDKDGLDTSKNFHVIYNGADEKRLQPTVHSLRAELGVAPDAPLLGMIGNFYREPRKDQYTLCRALPEIFNRIENAHCVFAGKTEAGAEHKFNECLNICRENGIENRVHFLGGRADVPDILAALDLFVFSSLHEGLPIAAAEAMLAGVPLLVSDIEPLLEATDNGNYGAVFPVGDEKMLAEKAIRLLKNKEARDVLSERSRAFARDKFSIDAHLKNLKRLYKKLFN